MIKAFEFTDDGRTYTCTVEELAGPVSESWWWFAVTGDQQRYAPFRAQKSDTQASVRKRVVEFYENRLFQLTQPTVRGAHWAKRKAPATTEAAPTAFPKGQ
jgi:hypothetical protein